MVEPIKANDRIMVRAPQTVSGVSEHRVIENNGVLYVDNFGMRVRIRDIAPTILCAVNGKEVDTVGEALEYLGKKSDYDILADALPSIDAFVDEHENETGMQRITDIWDVKKDDIIVTKSGERYICMQDTSEYPENCDTNSDSYSNSIMYVSASFTGYEVQNSGVYLKNTVFDYALRKVEVPTEPGFYKDKYGKIAWVDSSHEKYLLFNSDGIALPIVVNKYLPKGLDKHDAPFTRMKLVEECED